MSTEKMAPMDIEKRSFEILSQELGRVDLTPQETLVLKRVIHTSADFDYKENLKFSPTAVEVGLESLRQGALIVTDTQMAKAGINKAILKELGSRVECYIADEDVREAALVGGTTRAAASMNKLTDLKEDFIVAVGNAPTALIQLHQLITEGKLLPKLIIAVPVGFVNVVESKELILQLPVPTIVARGLKGGSNVAAAICNALIYQIKR